MKDKRIILDGQTLSIDKLGYLVKNVHVKASLSPNALKSVSTGHEFLRSTIETKNKFIIYGINTGFGPMADRILGPNQLLQLQNNLIVSHSVGMGEPIDPDYVLSSMVVRLNTLAKGHSGVSNKLLSHLSNLINHRVLPIIPEHGAVGTSGDLIQLAHIALVILGKGEVYFQGKRQSTKSVFKKLKLKPYDLKPKEGLSLINGTSVMSGIAALLCQEAKQLIDLEIRLGALSLELVGAYSDSISEKLHALRPHKGQMYVANKLRELLKNSKLLNDRAEKTSKFSTQGDLTELDECIQEVYSLRCIAQILGPVWDILQKVWNDVEIEINSVTDNPIIDFNKKTFLHGGNFHGDYIAAAMDQLKIGIVKMTMLSDRRINYFLNEKINKRFPPFLNLKTPGLTLGLQGLQFVATSTTANNQSLAFPHHIHSISTNGDNQDVVSMGTDAALIAAKVIKNAQTVQTIEVATLCQAVDFLNIHNHLSNSSQNLYETVRSEIPKVVDDRVLYEELGRLNKKLYL